MTRAIATSTAESSAQAAAGWWALYRKTYTPLKSARNRDAQIVAHFLPHFGARPLDTRWLQAGGDIYKLSKILGRSSVAVTEAHYAHLLKEDLVAFSWRLEVVV